MTDIVSRSRRSQMMGGIGPRDTKPEIVVRRLLHRLGYRFRLHVRKLEGRPDIVLPRHRIVIFVHGCFWHRHPRCRLAYTPKSNIGFWLDKFDQNVKRDARNRSALRRAGWRVVTVWECQTRAPVKLAERLPRLLER